MNPHLLPPSPKGDLLGLGLFGNHKAIPPHFNGERFLSLFSVFPVPPGPCFGERLFLLLRDRWECFSLVFEIEPQHIFVPGVSTHHVSEQDTVKSGCFLQLSNHLSTCGFSHIYYFCGRRGVCVRVCMWQHEKVCVEEVKRQLILYRVVHRSVSPRPCSVTSSNASVRTRVCLQGRNCPAGHLATYFNMISFFFFFLNLPVPSPVRVSFLAIFTGRRTPSPRSAAR